MTTKEQLDSFHQFASEQIDNGGTHLSLDELYELWRTNNPTADELADSATAVNAAIADMKAGDTGRPARQALRETCDRLGLVIDE